MLRSVVGVEKKIRFYPRRRVEDQCPIVAGTFAQTKNGLSAEELGESLGQRRVCAVHLLDGVAAPASRLGRVRVRLLTLLQLQLSLNRVGQS